MGRRSIKLPQKGLIATLIAVQVLWMGGFTFYALFVIPTGQRILHSHYKMGLITQEVSGYLNWIGLLLAFLNIAFFKWIDINVKLLRISFIFLILQLSLFLLHPVLDQQLLDPSSYPKNRNHFYQWHRVYLILIGIMWLLGIWLSLHLFVPLFRTNMEREGFPKR